MDKIFLTAADGVKLAGTLWEGDGPNGLIVFHQMPLAKESWELLAARLQSRGMTVLAIDFRGHGESGGGDYREFTDAQHQAYELDVACAVRYLEGRFPMGQIFLGGASIGANEVLKFMSEHHEVPKGFALSAGLDYHGVRALDYVKELSPHQHVWFAGSRSDMRKSGSNCGDMAEQLYDHCASRKEKVILETGGHGTEMFMQHPELMDEIAQFLI